MDVPVDIRFPRDERKTSMPMQHLQLLRMFCSRSLLCVNKQNPLNFWVVSQGFLTHPYISIPCMVYYLHLLDFFMVNIGALLGTNIPPTKAPFFRCFSFFWFVGICFLVPWRLNNPQKHISGVFPSFFRTRARRGIKRIAKNWSLDVWARRLRWSHLGFPKNPPLGRDTLGIVPEIPEQPL